MSREDHSERSKSLLVHDSQAVHVQGRGCHPRGQAKGSESWAHIEQSPLKLQEGPENSFSALPPASSQQQQLQLQLHTAGEIRQTKSEISRKVEPAAVKEDDWKRGDWLRRERGKTREETWPDSSPRQQRK